ncbi:XRE family transcriptional regulator [Burkholderia sp. CpTa8-5]|uniref:XRE family transcriptional regulator n=1 Tax=Burkholderia sola TaxID=2843302 RepID=UPI001AE37E92|nr:XRE family transcriptional regulator [Burkholderia sp. CpTa8-5]
MIRTAHLQGTDNVLVDPGFEEAPELTAKATQALRLNELIDQRGLSKIEAATITVAISRTSHSRKEACGAGISSALA